MTSRVGLEVKLQQAGAIPLDVSLTAASGELTALVESYSGSGKTTLLRAIAGLTHPDQGKVRVDGQTWFDTDANTVLMPQDRNVGLVFQDYALFPHLNVAANIGIALHRQSKQQRAERVRELLELVRLKGLEQRMPANLSGGEQQRVALARALAPSPKILLLDEPFSAVDTVTRRKLRLELSNLIRDIEIPILLVTHDLDEACMLAESVAVIHGGETLQQGSPESLIRQPRNATVARLLDARNIFSARITKVVEDDFTQVQWGDHELRVDWQSHHRPGVEVRWCIRPGDILLVPKGRPMRRTPDNLIPARVDGILSGAGLTQVVLKLCGDNPKVLHLELPPHVADRNSMVYGGEVDLSLPSELIHLMPENG